MYVVDHSGGRELSQGKYILKIAETLKSEIGLGSFLGSQNIPKIVGPETRALPRSRGEYLCVQGMPSKSIYGGGGGAEVGTVICTNYLPV